LFLRLGHSRSFHYLSFRTGTSDNTLSSLAPCPRYNGIMRYKLMLLGVFVLFRVGGCDKHPLTDYRPLDQAGMWSSSVEQLKTLNTADVEVAQLVKLKQAGITDDTCITLVSDAHEHRHQFASADSAVNLARAGYAEPVILEIAKTDQLDSISGDAVVLKLVGLSDSGNDWILHRRLKGQRTMSSAEIGRLKNTGLTEKQILERISQGMTDAQADKEAALREATRNHSGTGFARVRGRR
jgi:hypothetical protein